MALGLSAVNLANPWLDMLGGSAFTAPSVFAVKLHTGDPGSAGTTSAAAGDTTRKTVTWGAASAGAKAMTSMSGSWTNGGTSETLTHISGWNSTTVGNFLLSGALSAAQAWASGNTFSLSSVSVSFSPIAA